ncbi:MAG: hypothetical protein H6686_03865 [Fibrobacteria bacterium]|nr:hypothetical protein [Fibrobacteria bacterium]
MGTRNRAERRSEGHAAGRLRTILLLGALASPMQAQQGFFGQQWASRVYSPSGKTIASAAPDGTADIAFRIDLSDTVRKVLPTLYGNNLAAWAKRIQDGSNLSVWEHPYTLRHLRNAGITYLRLPGGAWANSWFWDKDASHWPLKSSLTSMQIYDDGLAAWSMTFEEMLRTCDSVGAKPQPIVNMGLARLIDEPNPVQKAASYAAGWVRHAKSLGRNIEVWEVGNEDYGRWMVNWEVDGDTIDGVKYGTAFNVFADSMKAADPRIKVGAVLYPDFKDAPSATEVPHWTEDVIATTKDRADFYIVHEYFTWNSADINLVTFDEVLAGRDKIARQKSDLDSLILALAGKEIPVAMTEFNMRAGQKNTTLVSTLFFAEALAEFAQAGYGLVNAWNINNGKSTDDHGMLARMDWDPVPGKKAAEVTASQAEESTPHPHFFSYYYYGKYFGDAMVRSTGGDDGTHLYASTFSNGVLGIVLVNEGPNARRVELDLEGAAAQGAMRWHTVTGDSLGTRSIVINGQGAPTGKVYGPRDYEDIPAYARDLDSNSQSILFEAPKYSASFLAVPLAGSAPVGVEGRVGSPSGGDLRIANGRIGFALPQQAPVTLTLHDLRGGLVGKRDLGILPAGEHSVSFGQLATSSSRGIQLLRLEAGKVQTTKLLLDGLNARP